MPAYHFSWVSEHSYAFWRKHLDLKLFLTERHFYETHNHKTSGPKTSQDFKVLDIFYCEFSK